MKEKEEEQKNLVNGSILDILPALLNNKNERVFRNTSVHENVRKRRRKSNFSRNNDTSSIERHASQGSSRSRRSSKGRVDRTPTENSQRSRIIIRRSSSSSTSGVIAIIEIREEREKSEHSNNKKDRRLSDSDTSRRKKDIRNRKRQK